ncbi:MAG TPA: hypothetical protein VFB12_31855 [Ktedonobacteraceae bacterium]|nr:hypothetical protein [Ktedonobacteraceae bacterium]
MRDREREQAPDDFTIEMVDLDADNISTSKEYGSPLTKRSLLVPRFTKQQRRIQLATTLSIVALALIVLLGSYAPTRNLVSTVLQSPQPAHTPIQSNGQDLFYFKGSPSWGRLFIDGKVISHLPDPRRENPLQMPRGLHTALWSAAPFSPQLCTFSVPPNMQHDTCSYTSAHIPTIGSTDTARQINLLASLTILPQAQRSALTASVQRALDTLSSSETVQPGEPYAVASQKAPVAIAQEPLRAKLHFILDSNVSLRVTCMGIFELDQPGCFNDTQDCHPFCDATPYFETAYSATAKEWDVFIVARAAWDYALENGTVIARDQPDSTIAQGFSYAGITGYEHMIPARIIWDGKHWQSTILSREAQRVFDNSGNQNPVCASTWDEMQINQQLNQLGSGGQQIDWRYSSGAQNATGCLAVGVLPGTAAQSSWAQCLHRFGVMLAANDVAHKAWPQLPVADAATRSLVQQESLHIS